MMNMLETYIRSILNEDESFGTPTLDDVGMVLDPSWDGVSISFIDTRLKIPITHSTLQSLIGNIQIHQLANKCYDGYYVGSSYSKVKGFGKYLYRMAGQYAHSKGKTLFSDRTSVSADAAGVWSYIYKNTDKEDRKQFDDIKNPKTPPISDDCEINRQGRNVLNYAYDVNFPGDAGLYEKMLENGERWIAELGVPKEKVLTKVSASSFTQFRSMYDNMPDGVSKKYNLS